MIAPGPDELNRLLDAYRHASHYGHLSDATHRATERNPACGDAVTFDLAVGPDGAIRHAAYSGGICAVGIAAASALCSMLELRPTAWLREITDEDFVAALPFPVPRQRQSCAYLPLHAARKALDQPL